ncbi:MAG: HAMP domain-containing histidine kinase [Acidobacteriota bacterium]|nr:HAMP domain-containing histidine kinase [Acidobacteriota bacterium]
MLLRRKISIVAAAAVAIAVAIAVLISYFAVRDQLVGQINNELRDQASAIQRGYEVGGQLAGLGAGAGGSAPYLQVVRQTGQVRTPAGQFALPDARHALNVADGTARSFMATVTVRGARLQMFTFQVLFPYPYAGQTAFAVQLARPLAAVDNVLRTLRWVLALVFLLVVVLAALLARMATHRVMRPLAEVTATAQLIGETDDLSQRIEVHEDDEVGQLATRFNEMLERLESSRAQLDASVTAQRQLVADASHELRTPVTSLRTNIEVLLSGAELDEEDRRRLLTDVVEQSEELSTLVSDLIEVARGDTPPTSVEDLRLDRLAEDAIDRARRNAPNVEFLEYLVPIGVRGDPDRLMRAINNLLDNAAVHAGHGGPVEVTVDQAGVTVRDHGDGIAEGDLPHLFDRFYRGANSRARQGSGLGLSIVRQAAQQHGGSISVRNAADGGAVFTLVLPTTADGSQPDSDPSRPDRLWSGEHGGQDSSTPDDAGVPRDAEVSA